ncbi:hypothetical protein DPMN_077849 [Dreissena polymorpha]|uniref:FLYWCH-type domain-containing protein n=1 Tax=Dreissena polymorpha TaxID=45954 RepID=A0A9D3YRE4_DREPO|nr:hypothetical protein DPMN_077849 [Dreissena polymorpha]
MFCSVHGLVKKLKISIYSLVGVSKRDYLKAQKQLFVLEFVCGPCKRSQAVNISTNGIETALHSTLINESTATEDTYFGTFHLELSLNTTNADSTVDSTADSTTDNTTDRTFDVSRVEPTNTTAFTEPSINGEDLQMSTTYIEEPIGVQFTVIGEDRTADSITDNTTDCTADCYTDRTTDRTFDVSRGDPPNTTAFMEPSINGEDLPMSTTVLEEPNCVHFTVIEEGTLKKCNKLVSSDGFAYIIKKTTKKAVQWRCNQRRTGQICYASVRQEGDIFSRGTTAHNHPADPLMRQKVEISRDVSKIMYTVY